MISVITLDGAPVDRPRSQVDWEVEAAQKDGYADFMSKEIREQPRRSPRRSSTGRARRHLEIDELASPPRSAPAITRCSSWLRVELSRLPRRQYAIEHWARLSVEIDIAARVPVPRPGARRRTRSSSPSASPVRRSTPSTPSAEHKELGRQRPGHLQRRRLGDGPGGRRRALHPAGPEIGVAATKADLAQIAPLETFALHLAQVRETLSPAEARGLRRPWASLPDEGGRGHRADRRRRRRAEGSGAPDVFFLGRGIGYPVALEGALKLKELAYVRAEAYPAGELKHGPIALIEGTSSSWWRPAPRCGRRCSRTSRRCSARGRRCCSWPSTATRRRSRLADEVLWVPAAEELVSPILDIVPLQMFAYSIARLHGNDVDRPRNLAKVVTVE